MGLLHICMLNQFPRKHQVIVMTGNLALGNYYRQLAPPNSSHVMV